MIFDSKLEKYKYDNGHSTSEDAFYIKEQPKDTCPMIDKVVNGINSALREIDDLEKEKDYDLFYVRNYLEDLENIAEEARENVEKIREWGQQWKDAAKKYFEMVGEIND